jgi:thiol-disulfide isomerase/thioredoxin
MQQPEHAAPVAAEPAVVAEAPTVATQVAFELNGLDGNTRQFSEWDGKHRIVNFWATWCAPCRREIPLLKSFQDQHGADGFQVIGIAVEFPEPVIAYAEETQFNYPILVGEQDAMAVAESSGISFIGLPFTMIVTRDGTLLGAHMGEIHQQHLDDIVRVMTQLDADQISLEDARTALDLM